MPALANYGLQAVGMFPKNNVSAKMLEVILCTMSLTGALPFSIALFKSRSQINAEMLEEEFRTLKTDSGVEIKELFFNKGM